MGEGNLPFRKMKETKLQEMLRCRQAPGCIVSGSKPSDMTLAEGNKRDFGAMESSGLFKPGSMIRQEMAKDGIRTEGGCKDWWDKVKVKSQHSVTTRLHNED